MKRLKWFLIAAAVIAVGLTVLYFVMEFIGNIGYKVCDFYYPEYNFKDLYKETRKIKPDGQKEPFPVLVVRQYLLGPINYNLRLSLPEDVAIKRVWLLSNTNNGVHDICINFNKKFTNYLVSENDSYRMMLLGLAKTLKSNTKVHKIHILVEDNLVKAEVGFWNIYYPVFVQ